MVNYISRRQKYRDIELIDTMYKLRIFSSFGPSEECKEVFERLCQTHMITEYGEDNTVYITNSDDYTHVIILNTAMPRIPAHIPKKNVIGLAYEPIFYLGLTEQFIEYAKANIGTYYIGDKGDLPDPFTEHYAYMWHMTPLKHVPIKTATMSIMISLKYQMPGHKYRHDLTTRILKERLPVDIYGRGCKVYNTTSPHLKGEFTETEPYERYDFHIAIENSQSNHYFSEKIINPLLCSTTPVYLGCKHIQDYFPEEVICMSGNVDEDIELIKNIIRTPSTYKKEIDTEKVKKRVSLIENVKTIFSE